MTTRASDGNSFQQREKTPLGLFAKVVWINVPPENATALAKGAAVKTGVFLPNFFGTFDLN